jgi:hypothetical protein
MLHSLLRIGIPNSPSLTYQVKIPTDFNIERKTCMYVHTMTQVALLHAQMSIIWLEGQQILSI